MRYKPEPHWYAGNSFFKRSAPAFLQSWLTDRESLTRRLIYQCNQQQGQFRVVVFQESWEKPLRSEAKTLGMKSNELGFVRQVHLFCDDKPWVYAKTVIPRETLHGELQKLTKLGTQPLGAVLFANKHISRGSIEIAKITKKHAMFEAAVIKNPTLQTIWGRRSIFKIKEKPLLVSEIFLPDLTA